ncbi:hypothetical protein DMA11_18000 [Marinilabiliaceae bacterium JC017]|nr:hypothetical protein DMA11_18000 [Marinilabiliaceae bacterium JC017]
MANKRIAALLVSLILIMVPAFSQLLEKQTHSGDLSTGLETSTIAIPVSNDIIRRVVHSNFWVSLDFGEESVEARSLLNDKEEITVTFTMKAFKGNELVSEVFGDQEFRLSISKDQPEAFMVRDLLPFFSADNSSTLTFDQVKITVVSQNISSVEASVQSKVNFKWNLSEKFGVSCQNIQVRKSSATIKDATLNEVAFNWELSDDRPVSYFQLQILKLFNEDKIKAEEPGKITATIHWEKAGSYIIKNDEQKSGVSFNKAFTISEGTGFYVWRIRPVSAFFEGGLADPGNYGEWSTAPQNDQTVEMDASDASSLSAACFYFVDAQQDKNYNYNRVFAEYGKNKEVVTYANRLNQVRQTATYLPSEKVSVVTQTVLDHTGRPALVTMPVPVDGKKLGYHEKLLKTKDGKLYTSDSFDNDENFLNPEAVDETGEFGYYGKKDNNVAAAEGYPYTRTLFQNDGTGRIKEQSGVGATHRLHPGSDENKHTTRYLYETATQEELIELFGDEAPNAENVFKTITIDPNQVATVSYTNKEGQTIATGLAYSGDKDAALLNLDGESAKKLKIKNIVTNNVKSENGFISSKRINITQQGTEQNPIVLNIEYKVKKHMLEQLCIKTDFDCNYRLDIKVIKLNDDNSSELIGKNSFWKEELNEDTKTQTDYKKANWEVTLPSPGTYIVQKELVPQGLSVFMHGNNKEINNQVRPITSFIIGMLEEVEDREALEEFFIKLKEISVAINGKLFDSFMNTNYPGVIAQSWFDNTYLAGDNKDKYIMTLGTRGDNGEIVTEMILSTPCCRDMVVPINWTPPFDCDNDDNEDGVLDENEKTDRDGDGKFTVDDVPDYERYMVEALLECMHKEDKEQSRTQTVIDFYKEYMTGWDNADAVEIVENTDEDYKYEIKKLPGIFNEMVYHMINDRYATEPGGPVKVQYKCEELFECWAAVVMELKQLLPDCQTFNYETNDGNVSKAYDKEYGNDKSGDKYNKNHDKHFDSSIKGGWFLMRWIAKRKVSKRMRNLQIKGENNEADLSGQLPKFHLVKEFLDCAGYKFAKILTPFDPNPLKDDCYNPSEGFEYSAKITEFAKEKGPIPLEYVYPYKKEADYITGAKAEGIDNYNYLKASDGSHVYLPLENWCQIDPVTKKPVFKNIRNPYYAFKYFYYDNLGSDDYQLLESMVCYTDPNDCYKTEVINGENFFTVRQSTDPASGKRIWLRDVYCCCLTVPEGTDPALLSYDDFPLCYYDEDYHGKGNGKWVVREFTDMGRVRCPYNSEQWNDAQRLTFFEMLKNYVIPSAAHKWEGEGEITIEDYITPHKWYYNNDIDELDYILTDEGVSNSEHAASEFVEMEVEDYLKDADGRFIMVEKEMDDLKVECVNDCERRRGEFRSKLYDMFNERCYVIGGCRTDDESTWNVIPEEDVEMMINALVHHCKQQCKINTFSIDAIDSRQLKTSNKKFGPNERTVKIQYGMGGHPAAAANGYHDDDPVFVKSFDTDYRRYTFDTDNDSYPDDKWKPSWYQYTMLKQVKEWDCEITLPDKCYDPADKTANTTPDPPSEVKDTHYLERKEYEINPVGIPDENNPKLNDPVLSPTKLLKRGGGPDYDEKGILKSK